MLKEFLIVGTGSFFGGGLRYAVSQVVRLPWCEAFPAATMTVNILGSFIIGFVYALGMPAWLSPTTRLLLTTGFCGGFTTFSTFMNENLTLLKSGHYTLFCLYTLLSIAAGLLFVALGHQAGAWLRQ